MANLVVLSGLRRGAVVAVEAPVLVGRAPQADLRLPDTLVSARHAEFRPGEGGGVVLQDLASTNGTFLNDRPITTPTAVALGDVLRLGETRLLLTEAAGLPAVAPSVVRQAVVGPEPGEDDYAIRLLTADQAELILDREREATLPFVQALQGVFGRAWDLDDLYARIAERFARAVESEGVAIILPRRSQGELEVVYRGRVLDGEVYRRQEPDFAIREDLVERALELRSAYLAQAGADCGSTVILLGASATQQNGRRDRTAICVPLPSVTGPVGAVYLHATRGDLDQADLDLLLVMASLAGVHLRGRQLVARLQSGEARAEAHAGPAAPASPAESTDPAGAVRADQRLLARIIEHVPEAIVSMTLDGVVTSWSPGAQALYEHAPDDVIGEPLPTLPDAELGHLDALLAEVAAGRTLRQRTTRVTASDLEVPVAITLAPVVDDRGQVEGILEISRDIREELADEERTRWRERLAGYGELARGLAHELANPLTNLRSGLELLLARPCAADEARPTLQVLLEELTRLQRLTRRALDLTTALRLTPEAVDLSTLLERAAAAASPRAEQRGVTVRVERGGAPVPAAFGDRDLLAQVAQNLVANAIEAMPDGGTLALSVVRADALVGFAVRDTGVGISLPDQARVWDPFFSRTVGGAGMGLALVRRIVDHHEGRLRLETAFGAGTTVTVLLPAAPGQAVE